jgi:hypothetical protein
MDENLPDIIEFFVKSGETRHRNPEVGPKLGEIEKNPV